MQMSAAKCEACEENFNEEQRKPRKLDCGCILCEKCIRGIYNLQSVFQCRKHNITTQRAIETLPILQNFRPQEFCQIHQQQLLGLYCALDKVRICVQCQKESHQGHDCITEQEAIQQIKSYLESIFRAIKQRLDNYESMQCQVQQRMNQEQISGRNKLFHFLIEVKQQIQQVFKELVNEQQGQLEQQMQQLKDIHDQYQMIGSQIGIFSNSSQDSINQYEYKKGQLNQFDVSIQEKFQQISQANDKLSQDQFNFQNIEGKIIAHLMYHFQPNVVQGQISQVSQIKQYQQVIRRQYQEIQELQGQQQKIVQENFNYKDQMRILLNEQESLKSTLMQLESSNKTSSDQLKLKEKQQQEQTTSLEKCKSQAQYLKDFSGDEIVQEPIFKYAITKRVKNTVPPRISIYRRIFLSTNKIQSYQLDNVDKVCGYRQVSQMTSINGN